MLALTVRLFQQLRRDPRTLAMAFVAPLLLIWLLSLFVGAKAVRYRVDVGALPPSLMQSLDRAGLSAHQVSGESALSDLKSGRAAAYLSLSTSGPRLLLQGASPQTAQVVRMRIAQALAAPAQGQSLHLLVRYLYGGPGFGALSYELPPVLAFFLFFFAYILSGITFLRERLQGTLERLLYTPLRPLAIVSGYFAAFGVVAAVQSALVLALVFGPLGARYAGSLALLGLLSLLVAWGGVVLGLLLSTLARSEFQVIQFIPLVIVPQALFSGILPLDSLPRWLQDVGAVLPMTYAVDAFRRVAIEANGFSDIGGDITVLLSFILVLGGLNVALLHRRQAA